MKVCTVEGCNKQVKDITINDLRYFIQTECEGLSECTVNNKISYTQNFFKWLVDEEIIDKDVSKKLKRIKEPLKLRKPLTMEEIERLRISCKDSRDRAILEFLLSKFSLTTTRFIPNSDLTLFSNKLLTLLNCSSDNFISRDST